MFSKPNNFSPLAPVVSIEYSHQKAKFNQLYRTVDLGDALQFFKNKKPMKSNVLPSVVMRSEAVDIVDTGMVTMCKCIHYRLHSFV